MFFGCRHFIKLWYSSDLSADRACIDQVLEDLAQDQGKGAPEWTPSSFCLPKASLFAFSRSSKRVDLEASTAFPGGAYVVYDAISDQEEGRYNLGGSAKRLDRSRLPSPVWLAISSTERHYRNSSHLCRPAHTKVLRERINYLPNERKNDLPQQVTKQDGRLSERRLPR